MGGRVRQYSSRASRAVRTGRANTAVQSAHSRAARLRSPFPASDSGSRGRRRAASRPAGPAGPAGSCRAHLLLGLVEDPADVVKRQVGGRRQVFLLRLLLVRHWRRDFHYRELDRKEAYYEGKRAMVKQGKRDLNKQRKILTRRYGTFLGR